MQPSPRHTFLIPFLLAMLGIALILLASITLILMLNRYLGMQISFEQSLQIIFMLVGSLCLPWITQRFFKSSPQHPHTALSTSSVPKENSYAQKYRWGKIIAFALALTTFWVILGPWSYVITMLQYLSHWTYHRTALFFFAFVTIVLSSLFLAAILHFFSRYIFKIDSKQQYWNEWCISLSFGLGLLIFAQLLLNIFILKFL